MYIWTSVRASRTRGAWACLRCLLIHVCAHQRAACAVLAVSRGVSPVWHTWPQVLEPSEDRAVFKDWEKMGSEIAELGLYNDEEQPLPTSESLHLFVAVLVGGDFLGTLGAAACYQWGGRQAAAHERVSLKDAG
jgi:hypothetical protein